MTRRTPPPELEELIASIADAPPPPRRPIRLPRRLLISLGGLLGFIVVLALAAPGSLRAVLTDPVRAVSLAAETISSAISILTR
jgi:hypothetical protein